MCKTKILLKRENNNYHDIIWENLIGKVSIPTILLFVGSRLEKFGQMYVRICNT